MDDIAHAHARGRLVRGDLKLRWRVDEIGPAIELISLVRCGAAPEWLLDEHTDLTGIDWIRVSERLDRARCSGPIGMIPALSSVPEEFMSFVRHASNCAAKAGFPTAAADKLASALGELRGNIEDHSDRSDTGLLFYAGAVGRFEIGAVDRGIGVLSSLRSCAEHAHLTNDGDALRLAISDGGSRYGSQSNHGHGFRPIFVGLANHSGHLRFRSGPYALEIDGKDPQHMPITVAQKPALSGLFVSVSCRP